MKTPKIITKQLENLVGASFVIHGNNTTYEKAFDEIGKEIDKTCKIINNFFRNVKTIIENGEEND